MILMKEINIKKMKLRELIIIMDRNMNWNTCIQILYLLENLHLIFINILYFMKIIKIFFKSI